MSLNYHFIMMVYIKNARNNFSPPVQLCGLIYDETIWDVKFLKILNNVAYE